jgi:hypothetical protein
MSLRGSGDMYLGYVSPDPPEPRGAYPRFPPVSPASEVVSAEGFLCYL